MILCTRKTDSTPAQVDIETDALQSDTFFSHYVSESYDEGGSQE